MLGFRAARTPSGAHCRPWNPPAAEAEAERKAFRE